MIRELTDIIKENWLMIPSIALGVYGCIEAGSGMYEIITTGTNQGLVEVAKGTVALGFAGISVPLLYKLSEYPQK